MRYGRLDRRVTLQRRTGALTASGQPFDAWNDIATRWASVGPVRGTEGYSTPQIVATEQVEIQIRYSAATADIHPGDRVIFPSGSGAPTAIYNILAVHEIGRREGHKIVAERLPVPDSGIPDPFDPVLLGVKIWADLSDLSTLFTDVNHTQQASPGDRVAAVFNKGSLGGYWTQGTELLRPVLMSAGGVRWLQYTVANETLSLSHSTVEAPCDILLAARPEAANVRMIDFGTEPYVVFFGAAHYGTGGMDAVAAATQGNDMIVSVRTAAPGTPTRIAVDDGAHTETSLSLTFSETATRLTSAFSDGPYRLHGLMLGFDSLLSDANRLRAINYQAGLQGRPPFGG